MATRPINKITTFGGTHPLFGWLTREMLEIIKAADLPGPLEGQVRLHVLRGIEQLARADEKKGAFLEKCQRVAVRAARGLFEPGEDGVVVEVDGMSDDYQLFLIRLIVALRLAFKGVGMILTGESRRWGWRSLAEHIKQHFGEDHPLRAVVDGHDSWTAPLFGARNEVEHDAFIFDGFFVLRREDGGLEVDPPRMLGGAPIPEALPRYWRQGLELFEELVARALETRLPAGRILQEIPEASRDPHEPIRFNVV